VSDTVYADARPGASASRTVPAPTALLACSWTARVVVAGVFVMAAWGKIADPLRFAETIRNYQMVPAAVTNVMAYTIPWIELAAAVLLLAGPLRAESRVVLLALLVIFTIAKGYVAAMGLKIDCGCFGGMGATVAKVLNGPGGFVLNAALVGLLIADGVTSNRLRGPRRGGGASPATSRRVRQTPAR
jgi:uncharacterized membrane protein YphA (DoxX/SURF4 family)